MHLSTKRCAAVASKPVPGHYHVRFSVRTQGILKFYRGFSQSLQERRGSDREEHNSFLPNNFQLTIHRTPYHRRLKHYERR